MASAKPLALVLGGTGRTGGSIVDGLLNRGTYDVAVLTRSISSPAVDALAARGVHTRVADIEHDDPSTLQSVLAGVDVVISAVSFTALFAQKNIVDAAAAVGVKRFIPCDFGTYTPPGVRALMDKKYEIRAYVRARGVPYTFVDVGWWMQLGIPYPARAPPGPLKDLSLQFCAAGDKPSALTDCAHIGAFVARIVEDARTLNQYVFCAEDELTLAEAWAVAARVSGEQFVKKEVSAADMLAAAAEGKADYIATASFHGLTRWTLNEYQHSNHVRGDNTVANAVAAGALDARELYPDLEVHTFEDFAREFYKGMGVAV